MSVFVSLCANWWLIYRILGYENEESVGTAIRESGLGRDDLYVTTKWGIGEVQDAVRASLSKVCLLLIMWENFVVNACHLKARLETSRPLSHS
jgi:diketogulonate reductase-like aldo/keto reductase